jgi:hypothetical protein
VAAEWWSVEVFDAETSAAAWRDAYAEALVESAITHGALFWEWHQHSWGVVFEVAFAEEWRWRAWRELPGTQAALDAVPDPVNGLLVYRGRGGSSGAPVPRRPRLSPGAAAVELPEPVAYDDLVEALTSGEPGNPSPAPRQPRAHLR